MLCTTGFLWFENVLSAFKSNAWGAGGHAGLTGPAAPLGAGDQAVVEGDSIPLLALGLDAARLRLTLSAQP